MNTSTKQTENLAEYGNKSKPLLPAVFVGQFLFREVFSIYSPTEIKSYEIEKIGKKFIYVKNLDKTPINIEDLKYENKNYSQNNIQFYLTEQEILDKNERQHLIDKIRKTFDWQSNTTNFTLNQLRDVVKTLMGGFKTLMQQGQ